MSQQDSEENYRVPDLWRFVRMEQYSKPDEPTSETVRKGAKGVWESLQEIPLLNRYVFQKVGRLWHKANGKLESDEPELVQKELQGVPVELMDSIVLEPDWGEAVQSLERALQDWQSGFGSGPSLRFIVGAPFSGVPEILSQAAEAFDWKLVEEPSSEEILEGGADWLAELPAEEMTPLVIPRLEHCYLRHHNGLELMRKLVDWILSNQRPCLIGCNSWAWAYLSKALEMGNLFPLTLTVQAFDGVSLQRWFWDLALRGFGARTLMFRQADNGDVVLPPALPAQTEDGDEGDADKERKESPDVTDFLARVAAYARGIPGVAREVWRHSLRTAADGEVEKKAQEAANGDILTMWVKPWSQVDLPRVPDEMDRSKTFVLHSLLLHDGLHPVLLRQLLSISSTDVLETLHHLRDTGLVRTRGLKWIVSPLGYPAVRDFLNREGYLVDDL
jgi:hypothetical protein